MTQALIIRYKNSDQPLIIPFKNSDIEFASVVYENMLELKAKVEELSNKQEVESVELVFPEYD